MPEGPTPDLEPPDRFHLRAAEGWFELGDLTEAKGEIARLSAASRVNPDALELRWRLHAELKEWEEALEVARRLTEAAPDDPSGWIHLSYTLHERKHTLEAWTNLLAVADRFAGIPTVAYNLACYACRLGWLDEAREWLERAIRLRGLEAIRETALDDPDLEALWPELRQR